MLSAIGILPKNGWIAGYPVTPPVIGEIETSVATAADAGKLRMGKDEALKAVGDLKAKLGLSLIPGGMPPSAIQAAPGGRLVNTIIYKYIDKNGVVHYTDRYESVPKEYRDQIEMIREEVQPQSSEGAASQETGEQVNNYTVNPPAEVINNYYYNDGPPVVTYYAPPSPYYYLYAWVPYPFWSWGFFFPGYFILHDFHRHASFHGHPCVVTNHVAHGGRGGVSVVDPLTRTHRNSMVNNRIPSPRGFDSPRVQSSARAIVGLSQNRGASANALAAPRMAHAAPSASVNRPEGPTHPNQGTFNGRASQPRTTFGPPQAAGGRTFNPPAVKGRTFSPSAPRVFSPPSISQSQVFNGHATGGGRGFFGILRGSGSISGRGGSFWGGLRGHH